MELYLLYISLTCFLLGTLVRLGAWFTRDVWYLSGPVGPGRRAGAFFKGSLDLLKSRRLVWGLKAALIDVTVQTRLLKRFKLRWLMHIMIFTGFTGLTFMHALEPIISERFFPNYYSTVNPYFVLREIFGLIVLAGLLIAIARRLALRKKGMISGAMDYGTIAVLGIIVLSGLFLEAAKISSHSEFTAMVDEYASHNDEEEITALRAYWAKEYGLVFQGSGAPFDPEELALGAEINEESCISCHSSSKWAFAGYALTKSVSPASAVTLDRLGAVEILRWIHYLSCLLALAWLPFGKMFHMFSTPIGLIVKAVMGETGSREALAIRRAMALDSCTGCGTCSQVCSVRPGYAMTGNPLVLPSEKISFFRKNAGRKKLSDSEFKLAREGVTLCTDCGRCSTACTSGIDLRGLWHHMKGDLLDARKTDPMFLSPLSFARGMEPEGVCANKLETTKQALSGRFDELMHPERVLRFNGDKPQQPISGDNVGSCFGCGGCTSICPVVAACDDPRKTLGLFPHQIVHSVKINETEMAAGARMLWYCLTCYKCQEQCPQDVRVTDLFYNLKNRAYNQARGEEI